MRRRGKLRASRRRLGATTVGLAAACCTLLVFAYSPEQDRVNNTPVPTHWQNAMVTWNLNPTTGSNIKTTGGTSVQQTLQNAFNSWQNAQLTLNGSAVTLDQVSITLGQVSSSLPTMPNSADCVNVVGFTDSSKADFPTGTIAFTQIATVTPPPNPPTPYSCTSPPTTRTCNLDSCLADADIEFNPSQNFSTSSPAQANAFDLQSVATHEIGHLLGMDHSGLANAVMYPFGDTGLSQTRTLATDDVAGISFLYPASSFASQTGTLSGTVTLNSSGIFAAHVVVIDANSGAATLDTLTATNGTYSIQGVPPGTYNVLVLPLTGVYDITDFSGWSCGYAGDPATCTAIPTNPLNYSGTFH